MTHSGTISPRGGRDEEKGEGVSIRTEKLAPTMAPKVLPREGLLESLIFCSRQGTALKQVAWAYSTSVEEPNILKKYPQTISFAIVLLNTKVTYGSGVVIQW